MARHLPVLPLLVPSLLPLALVAQVKALAPLPLPPAEAVVALNPLALAPVPALDLDLPSLLPPEVAVVARSHPALHPALVKAPALLLPSPLSLDLPSLS